MSSDCPKTALASVETRRSLASAFQLPRDIVLDANGMSSDCFDIHRVYSVDVFNPVEKIGAKTQTTPHPGTFRKRRNVLLSSLDLRFPQNLTAWHRLVAMHLS